MKKNYLVGGAGVAALLFFGIGTLQSSSSGAPAGHSGSVASNNRTCATAGCHSGPATGAQTIEITTNIPPEGFAPNTNYTISVKGLGNGATFLRAGFQASVEDGAGVHQGSLAQQPDVQIINSGRFATHRGTSTNVVGGERNYSFTWNSGTSTDSVIVYTSFNFANGDGSTSGDHIKTAQLVLNKNLTFSAENLAVIDFTISPNPVADQLRIALFARSNQGSIVVMDLNGKVVAELAKNGIPAGYFTETFDLSHLPTGVYNVVVTSGNQMFTERILKR
jgi:hypothetical protein